MKANLSIIITNYNKPHQQVVECVDSIKEQTVLPKEIILVDDHSDEPPVHRDVTTLVLPKNLGVAHARNEGVHISSGELLLFLDADDKLAPDFIEQCGRVIDKADIAYPNVLKFGHIERNQLCDAPDEVTPEYVLGESGEFGLVVTSMMHRKVYEKIGGFHRGLPVFEDWDFWIKAMFNGYTFKKANTLLYYRQSDPRTPSRNRNTKELKTSVVKQITAPYQAVDGKLIRRNGGKQTPKNS